MFRRKTLRVSSQLPRKSIPAEFVPGNCLRDHAILGVLVVVLVGLMQVPPLPRAPSKVAAAAAFPGAWVRLVFDNPLTDDEPSFVFQMQGIPTGGLYETHMRFEGRTFTLRGTVGMAEFLSFMNVLESQQSRASGLAQSAAGDLLGPSARHVPRYTIYLMAGDARLRAARLDEPWSPQYQSLQRYLDRTVVGRTQDILKRAVGF